MPLPEGLICRRATVADYQNIMELNMSMERKQKRQSIGFLPSDCRYWLHSKRYRVYVAEHQGRIVGLVACYVSPIRHILSNFGARVHPDYWKTGTKEYLYHTSITDVLSSFPQITHALLDGIDSGYWRRVLSLQRDGENIKLEGKLASYSFLHVTRQKAEDLLADLLPGNHIKVRRFSPDELSKPEVIQDIQRRLALNGGIFLLSTGYLSLRINPESIHLAAMLSNMYVSYRGPCEQPGQMVGVSLSSTVQIEEGTVRFDMNYYGEDVEHMLAHFAICLKQALLVTRVQNLSYIRIRFPSPMDSAKVGALLETRLGPVVSSPVMLLIGLDPKLIYKL